MNRNMTLRRLGYRDPAPTVMSGSSFIPTPAEAGNQRKSEITKRPLRVMATHFAKAYRNGRPAKDEAKSHFISNAAQAAVKDLKQIGSFRKIIGEGTVQHLARTFGSSGAVGYSS